ncbi:MAG: hypothetical protein RLZZ58_821 [Pseudomonadota bacterium]
MNPLLFGMIAGVLFGALNVASMIPMQFPDKPTALAGAFFSRFAIGFLIPLVHMQLPTWIVGAGVGFLISLPDAIITKAYVPVMVNGIIGGAIIGWLAGRFVAPLT